MNREALYGKAPVLLKRLFLLGVTSAIAFLLAWYLGGMNLWGELVFQTVDLLTGFGNYQFDPGDSAKASIGMLYAIPGNKWVVVSFGINLLSVSFVEVVTVYAAWIHKNLTAALRLAFWCLLITLLYHSLHVILQIWVNYNGPSLANKYGQFYEAPALYDFIQKISYFDKLILRFWAGFPIFALALAADSLTSRFLRKNRPASKSEAKKNRKA